jgi:hypothetical protein
MGVWNDRYCIIEDGGFWRGACLGADGIVLVYSHKVASVEDYRIVWLDYRNIDLEHRSSLL